MKNPRFLVLHCPAGGGHKAAAKAIAEAAESAGIGCEVVDALALTNPLFARAYVGAHLTSTERAPGFYGFGYAALDQRRAIADRLRAAFDRAAGAPLRRFVSERAPSAIIATHFFPLSVLGRDRLDGRLRAPLIGVVTDYAAHAIWAEPGVDRFCAARGRAPADLARHGVSPGAIVATGIPVRPAFGRAAPLALPAAHDEPLQILVTSGGFGVGPMVQIIRSFAGIPWARLTVVCGDNPERVAQARRAAAEAGVRAEVIGFEHDMAARLAACHVVVGKPGGLTTSEALAAGRPMVIVGACPGQEALNQAWVVSSRAGVAADAGDAGRTVAWLRARGALGEMARSARAISAPDAAQRVLDVALRLAGERRSTPTQARSARGIRDAA